MAFVDSKKNVEKHQFYSYTLPGETNLPTGYTDYKQTASLFACGTLVYNTLPGVLITDMVEEIVL